MKTVSPYWKTWGMYFTLKFLVWNTWVLPAVLLIVRWSRPLDVPSLMTTVMMWVLLSAVLSATFASAKVSKHSTTSELEVQQQRVERGLPYSNPVSALGIVWVQLLWRPVLLRLRGINPHPEQ